jgi:hypothetical protein
MATRDQVLDLLDRGHSYETAGRALGVPAGQAYMIATGRPADGSDAPPARPARRPVPPGSSQHLVNPPAFNPTRNERVVAWVRERAARELTQKHGR